MLYLGEVVTCIDGVDISCSSLEDLVLENIFSNADDIFSIKISAARLKNLRIAWQDTQSPLHSLTLYAPKLEQFSWGGFVSHHSCEGNLESVQHADIFANYSFIPYHNEDNEHMALGNGIIGKLLQSMCHVISISIHDYSIKEISSRELLPEFVNLHSLTLVRTDSSSEITSIIFLLNSMPHLNTLKIQGCVDSKNEKICNNAEYWESQNLKFVHSLKEVEMEISGKKDELELIKYLLKNAEVLKVMNIHHSHKLRVRRYAISRQIQQFQIASSSIAISFFHRHQ